MHSHSVSRGDKVYPVDMRLHDRRTSRTSTNVRLNFTFFTFAPHFLDLNDQSYCDFLFLGEKCWNIKIKTSSFLSKQLSRLHEAVLIIFMFLDCSEQECYIIKYYCKYKITYLWTRNFSWEDFSYEIPCYIKLADLNLKKWHTFKGSRKLYQIIFRRNTFSLNTLHILFLCSSYCPMSPMNGDL